MTGISLPGGAGAAVVDFEIESTLVPDGEPIYNSYCFAGLSKSGRTHMAASFPESLFLDFDHGLRGEMRNNDYKKITFKQGDQTKNKVLTVLRQLRDRTGHFQEWMPKTVVIDTGSDFSYHLETELKVFSSEEERKKMPGKGDGLRIQDYNVIQQRVFQAVSLSKDIEGVNLIWIWNIDREKDESLGKLVEAPAATGSKLGPKLPHQFDEVYYFYATEGKYYMNFLPTVKFPYASGSNKMRDAYPNGVIVDPSWDKISEYL